MRRLATGVALLLVAACAPAMPDGEAAAPSTAVVTVSDTLVPPGLGTLRQDEVTVSIRSGSLLVKVTPLEESVIRLLAPDTYQRLSALRDSRRDEAARSVMRDPAMFLVSFFSYQPNVTFQPEDVQLVDQARLLRASSIIPMTSGWGQLRLAQQETQTAIYVFDAMIDYNQVLGVRYGMDESQEWRQIINRLELERGRILSRVR